MKLLLYGDMTFINIFFKIGQFIKNGSREKEQSENKIIITVRRCT